MVYFKKLFTETIKGKVEFSQGNATENITIEVSQLVGLAVGKHGFHVHSKGNCQDPGPHYNPDSVCRCCSNIKYSKSH